MSKDYKERHLYYFVCGNCGHKAVSFKRTRARKGFCRNCRRFEVDKNQTAMF
jgi:hypothetical protein